MNTIKRLVCCSLKIKQNKKKASITISRKNYYLSVSNDFAIVNLSHLTILRVTQITLTLSMSKAILYFFVRENVTSNKYLYNLPQINEWVFGCFFLLGGGGICMGFFILFVYPLNSSC